MFVHVAIMLDVKVRINARSLRSAGPEMALLPTADLQRFFRLLADHSLIAGMRRVCARNTASRLI
jgi:hypothetical protein